MKKKIMIVLAISAVLGCGLYFYMYKGHRDIATENADFTLTVAQLQQQFATDATNASKQYADKTIAVSGAITAIDAANHSVAIDEKLSVVFNDSVLMGITEHQKVKVKGRFVGYDDLLEEFKMDQAAVVE